MEMHWSWLIIIYLFLGGLGAGAYLTSFAAEKGWLGKNSSLAGAGYFISAPVVAVGSLLLVFDLGQGLHKPWLILGLLANFGSVMTWGVYILSGFIMIGLIKAYFAYKNKKAPALLTWAGAVLALATGTYTGLLLAAVQAIPFWSTVLIPVLFVVSALSTGMSATCLLAPFVEKELTEGKENEIHLLLVAVELVIAAVFFGIILYGIKGPIAAQSASLVVSGNFAIVFWGYFIGLGLVFPLVVYAISYLRSRKSKHKITAQPSLADGELAAVAEKGYHNHLVIATDLAVLIGGFSLRALIIFAALPLWDGVTIF